MLLKFEKVYRWDTLLARQKEQIGEVDNDSEQLPRIHHR